MRIGGNKKIQDAVRALLAYEPEKIYLFGSWSRGEEDDLSDMDFVLIKNTEEPFLDRLKEIQKFLPQHMGAWTY
ncbi:MAG: nucleotidyltransferase domain-containing protein [Deltaproteobacteria bacterium]|nr:nucleotidyltransferase domain-containing protein [Deltaproteobacteria bacterium]